jgi:hypothetical protein
LQYINHVCKPLLLLLLLQIFEIQPVRDLGDRYQVGLDGKDRSEMAQDKQKGSILQDLKITVLEHAHNALDDAIEQSKLFKRMLEYPSRQQNS